MLDAKSSDVFIEEINIYGKQIATQQLKNDGAEKYDIQFLPEGGHMVQNVENTIAFKAINQQGKGIYTTGIIYDENDLEITTFESNDLGIGTFTFVPKSNHTYKAKTTFEEDVIKEQVLPKVTATGISIQVDNLEKDSIKVSFNTNTATLRSIISKNIRY